MSHPLHSFRLKLNRAKAHAEALDAEIEAWMNRHPYELFGEYEAGPPEYYVFKVRFFEDIPPEWGILLGDFAHNARSALDHLAEALVVANTGQPGTSKTQFPIVVSPFDWPGQLYRLEGVSERHVRMIESTQPYRRTGFQGWHTGPAALDDPLALLNRLSNVDKHRVLNATPATVRSITWDFKVIRDVSWIDANHIEIPWEELKDGRELLKVRVAASGPNPEVELHRTETIEIQVQHRVDLSPDAYTIWSVNDPVQKATKDILGRLGRIFQAFVGEFG